MSGQTSGQDDASSGKDAARAHQRPWVHPSELPAAPRPATHSPPRQRARVPVTAGLVGAVAAFGITMLVRDADRSSRPGVPSSTAAFVIARPPGGGATGIALSAEPAVVGITAWSGAMPRYGSGIAYRHDGLIVTSAGIVGNATGIDVTLADGRSAAATLVGTDPDYDLAVLRAEQLELSPLEFKEQPPTPAVGAGCVVVGADHSAETAWATEGTVTSRGRVLKIEGIWMIDMLEIDARVNPEAVGGAVLDSSGELLGLLTKLGAGSSTEILVVPASSARRSVEQILDDGHVDHPWLGLDAANSGSPQVGAVIQEVDASGPARRAGLESGDVIIEIDEEPVRGLASLLREVRRQEVGGRVVVRVRRDGAELDLSVTIEARPRPTPGA